MLAKQAHVTRLLQPCMAALLERAQVEAQRGATHFDVAGAAARLLLEHTREVESALIAHGAVGVEDSRDGTLRVVLFRPSELRGWVRDQASGVHGGRRGPEERPVGRFARAATAALVAAVLCLAGVLNRFL